MAESLHILFGTSACLQWLCHSGEQTVARGPLVFFLVLCPEKACQTSLHVFHIYL